MAGSSTAPRRDAATLCLDLANTWESRSDRTTDRLGSYADLLRWAVAVGAVEPIAADALARAAEARPEAAAAVLVQARSLREAVYGSLSRLAAGHDPADDDLETINRALERTLPRLRLRADRACCRIEWAGPADALDRMLWPVARAAAELLTSPEVARVRECASPDCSWLFVDTSRNRSRKWCAMSGCGNRAKARRYYRRHRAGAG